MKKIISFLASVFLVNLSSSVVTSCDLFEPFVRTYDDCFDEDWNNVTNKGSDVKQWYDMASILLCFVCLSNDIFADSQSFYQNLNDKTSDELIRDSLRGSSGQILTNQFKYNFTFLITTYDSIDRDVIIKMKEKDLDGKDDGTYLFLNLPNIDLDDIKNATNLDFQLLFITKDSENNIIGNSNNNWFYWYSKKVVNIPSEDNEYFFKWKLLTTYKRVVTKYFEY